MTAYEQYLQTDAWRQRRDAALERAGHRCQVCNMELAVLVHHRTYERVGREDPSDLTVLCAHCHKTFHGKVKSRGADAYRKWKAWCENPLGDPLHLLDNLLRYGTADEIEQARTLEQTAEWEQKRIEHAEAVRRLYSGGDA